VLLDHADALDQRAAFADEDLEDLALLATVGAGTDHDDVAAFNV
jgi:hypothetical protein